MVCAGGFLALFLVGCAAPSAAGPGRAFHAPADTLSFTNQTVWEYRDDPATGRREHYRKAEPANYALHCFVMARLTKEFHLHAKFVPEAPPLGEPALRERVRRIVSLGPRRTRSGDPRVEVPGFADLWELSGTHAGLLREEGGSSWRSYFQRGNWRMVLPFWGALREAEARRLAATIAGGHVAVVHLVDFPSLRLNHAVLVHGVEATTDGWKFEVYDPNAPRKPLELRFDARRRRFRVPSTGYFGGGEVEAYEVYRNCIY